MMIVSVALYQKALLSMHRLRCPRRPQQRPMSISHHALFYLSYVSLVFQAEKEVLVSKLPCSFYVAVGLLILLYQGTYPRLLELTIPPWSTVESMFLDLLEARALFIHTWSVRLSPKAVSLPRQKSFSMFRLA